MKNKLTLPTKNYKKMRILIATCLLFLMSCNSKTNDDMQKIKSKFEFSETLKQINQSLKEKNIPVFAIFDHKKNADEVKLSLRPTQVIVFGSPKVGTLLMQENQAIAAELPLKITIWEDENQTTWISFPKMKKIAKKYKLSQHPIIPKMDILLEKLTENVKK